MENPFVSICCLTYNHESYIRQCLDGFVMQKANFPIEDLSKGKSIFKRGKGKFGL